MNYYEVLEVSPKASPEVIKAAYKSLMQRYHPDRNPGNAEVAERSVLVGQAYEALSDPARRAAYDTELNRQAIARLGISRERDVRAAARSEGNHPGGGGYSWFPWMLLAAAIMSGWFVLTQQKSNTAAREPELQKQRSSHENNSVVQGQSGQAGGDGNAEALQKRPGEQVVDRNVPIAIKLAINLRDADNRLESSGRVLSVPKLVVKVGTYDADKVIRYFNDNRESIGKELSDRLADADYGKLARADGEYYLKDFILDALGEMTGTDRRKEYPSTSEESPGRHGVVEVVLPDSFAVH
ncbi:MAG: J domain-containing protein [Nitrosomonadales bacterium]|nr:J domain-containing protein [Nitrosomonadales bacterium]